MRSLEKEIRTSCFTVIRLKLLGRTVSAIIEGYDVEIDVVMLTSNSNKPWFKRVLLAIKRNIPVHHFIVVDNYSTDGTINMVKRCEECYSKDTYKTGLLRTIWCRYWPCSIA